MLERMLYYLKLTREAERRIERVLHPHGKIVGRVYIGRGSWTKTAFPGRLLTCVLCCPTMRKPNARKVIEAARKLAEY
jgi:hypothetical protein